MAVHTGQRPATGAPPRPHRTARRRPTTPAVVLVLGLIAITLMLIDVSGGPTGYLRGAGQAVGGPLQAWADGALGALPAVPVAQSDPADLQRRNADLQQRNEQLRLQVDRLAEQVAAAGESAAADTGLATFDAAVVAAAAQSRTTLTVAAGRNDGVAVDTAVLADAGVIGRVVAVGPTTATVQLISDPASSVAVRLRGSRETALAVGAGDPNRIPLDLVDPLVEVPVGEALVTVGSPGDRPFPAGLRVGAVAEVTGAVGSLDRTVQMAPAADLTALDRVRIVLPGGDGAHPTGEAP